MTHRINENSPQTQSLQQQSCLRLQIMYFDSRESIASVIMTDAFYISGKSLNWRPPFFNPEASTT